MRKIGIRFSDNDFYNVLRAFMFELQECVLGDPWEPTKAQIVRMFNEIAFGLYLMRQNRFQYKESERELEFMRTYLRTDEAHVFIDEEVDEYVDKCNGWDNAEFHVLDMSTPGRPYVYNL